GDHQAGKFKNGRDGGAGRVAVADDGTLTEKNCAQRFWLRIDAESRMAGHALGPFVADRIHEESKRPPVVDRRPLCFFSVLVELRASHSSGAEWHAPQSSQAQWPTISRGTDFSGRQTGGVFTK